jgi:hypothetical protein
MVKPKNRSESTNGARDLRQAVAEGLLCTHSRINTNTRKTLEAASFLYALVELLEEKGLLSIEELDERKRMVGQRLAEQFRQNGNGVMLQDPEYDKYTFEQEVEIDCADRVHLCHAACCRLPFALSSTGTWGNPTWSPTTGTGRAAIWTPRPAPAACGPSGRCPAAPSTAARTSASGWTLRTKSLTPKSTETTGRAAWPRRRTKRADHDPRPG